jgi:hypothetical protein
MATTIIKPNGRVEVANRIGPVRVIVGGNWLGAPNGDTLAAIAAAQAAAALSQDWSEVSEYWSGIAAGHAGDAAASATDAATAADLAEDWAGLAGDQIAAATRTVDVFSGNGTTTVFTLSVSVADERNTDIFVGDLHQRKSTYSIVGDQLTFAIAPAAGTGNIEVVMGATTALAVASGPASTIVYDNTHGPLHGISVQTALAELAAGDFNHLGEIEHAIISSARTRIRVGGYASGGDCGESLELVRAVSEPSHPGKRPDYDGNWWEFATFVANPLWFGAKGDGTPGQAIGTDNTAAFQDAIAFAIAKELQRVTIPAGCFWFANASAGLDPGTGDMEFVGAGKFATILQHDESESGGDYNDLKHLFRNLDAVEKGRLAFSSLQVRGTFTHGNPQNGANTEGGGAAFALNYYKEIVAHDCWFYDLAWQVFSCEGIGRVRVFDNTFERTVRDMARFRSSPNVIITNNHFKHCDDDAVALHQAEYISGIGLIREGIIVANNIFEDCAGVHVLGGRVLTIHSNIFRRCKVHAVSVFYSDNEGRDSMFSISVYNNQSYDLLGRVVAGVLEAAPAYAISVVGHYATYDSGAGDLYPGRQLDAANYRDNFYVGQPTPAAEDIVVYGNRIRKTLKAVTNYSDWGFGEVFSATGFQDPEVTAVKQRPAIGILAPGGGTLVHILDNAIEYVGNGIQWGYNDSDIDSNYGGRWSKISRNTIRRVSTAGIYFGDTGALLNLPVEIENNDIDCDPLFESTGRNGDATGWTSASAGPCAIRGSGITGLGIRRNKFANCSEILRSIYSGEWDVEDNIVVCNPAATGFSTSNDGVGDIPVNGPGYTCQILNCDPADADYGEAIAGMKRAASAMPTGGKYVAGHFVRNTNMAVAVYGWLRLTTNSFHNSGTDWKTVALS